ncbi:Transcriptional regulator SlyA [Nonomuraea coxensis DSM 45129]|uniref:Transcriptional regulator SlyA n=1 Tax=Nonomuraea coxensis DSM 45129 TaxID=1122611 RepID=A0ABX8U396_9ACTN|nr:winged helix DNA-binding protein [Nonomuraea coxensis]QYC42212.1 Transcriptional regulator SlyA [Nonomuraea coxensis DSM 45129]
MERPIGYWLKHLDRLIEAEAERVLAEEGLTRRHWQVLNTLHQAPRTANGLGETLGPFWQPGAITLEDVTGELARRGWLTEDAEGRHTLTPEGLAGHAAAREKVHGIRSAFLTGLTEEEYTGTVRALRRMAANLEARQAS